MSGTQFTCFISTKVQILMQTAAGRSCIYQATICTCFAGTKDQNTGANTASAGRDEISEWMVEDIDL